ENLGPSAVPAGVVATDTFPAGVTPSESEADCSLSGSDLTCTTSGALAVGATVTFDVTVDVDPGYVGGNLANTATIDSSPYADSDAGNNSDPDTDAIDRQADLEID